MFSHVEFLHPSTKTTQTTLWTSQNGFSLTSNANQRLIDHVSVNCNKIRWTIAAVLFSGLAHDSALPLVFENTVPTKSLLHISNCGAYQKPWNIEWQNLSCLECNSVKWFIARADDQWSTMSCLPGTLILPVKFRYLLIKTTNDKMVARRLVANIGCKDTKIKEYR